MFSYYGSKSKIVDYYPPPKHDKIIEPFAGSARYSLKWFDRDVLLVDKYPVIIEVWHYLQQASEQDILGLPEPKYKEDIRDYNLSHGEKALMSFLVARGVASAQYIVQQFSDIPIAKKQIAKNLFKIRHWKIIQGDYNDTENETATWFVDPPYQFGGEHYRVNNKQIDFCSLSSWCKSRSGQVIVCENTKANWLPFNPVIDFSGAYTKTTEAIWTNYQTHYDFKQAALFG